MICRNLECRPVYIGSCPVVPSPYMSQRKYADQSLKSLIDEMLKNTGMKKKYSELEVIASYNKCVGTYIQKNTREIRMRNNTLIIKIDSGVLKQELAAAKSRLIDSINQDLGIRFVEEIEIW
jgi:Dna[CI] antecedent, DciA